MGEKVHVHDNKYVQNVYSSSVCKLTAGEWLKLFPELHAHDLFAHLA